jgi:hypothetical protein
MQVFVAEKPDGIDEGPEFGDEFFQKARGLVFVAWFLCKLEISVLECRPVFGEVTIKKMVPANQLLREK